MRSYRRAETSLSFSTGVSFLQTIAGAPPLTRTPQTTAVIAKPTWTKRRTRVFETAAYPHANPALSKFFVSPVSIDFRPNAIGAVFRVHFSRSLVSVSMCAQDSAETDSDREGFAAESTYKPRVATWGVFPRPRDISEAFGGGRAIPLGGAAQNDESSHEREQRLKALLDRYRGERAEITETAEERSALVNALEAAENMLVAGQYNAALERLSAVKHLAKIRGEVGGKVLLQIALCKDALGLREDAHELYKRLQASLEPDIRAIAKQLVYSFHAANWMRFNTGGTDMDDDSGLEKARLYIPALEGLESRYETTFSPANQHNARNRESVGVWSRIMGLLKRWFVRQNSF
ncbi:hypothetical protein CCYA_CCYA11G3107 [Cyanidiococcus yangmingshanensis]|nr:hypothetical protein CCYA_CCYA11G3107 [Cyanidiococcus yangmingshanensis]